MAGRISLNGSDWKFKEFHGADWVWRDACAPDTRDVRGWHSGTVPGSVQHDLWKLGEIADPYFEKNSLLCEWVSQRTWVYKRSFHAGQELSARRVQLVFEGVDYAAQFFLNGELLGAHTGMFTPVSFEIGERLKIGEENWIAVVIEPAPQEQPQVGYTSRVRTMKSRMGYWWDFCPRMVHLGIWQDVYLEVTGEVRIADVFIRTELRPACDRAVLNIAVDLEAGMGTPVQLEIAIRQFDEAAVTLAESIVIPEGRSQWKFSLEIANPHLWWPNGSGAQALYDASVQARIGGELSQERQFSFGIRRIEWLYNEGAAPDALPYTICVNGRKIYVKGWNWVPIDVCYGVSRPEKLARLLQLAQRAQVNMLRVWGGGLIETEAFYTACDRLGIMVWQEFIQSSSGIDNTPPDSADYIHMLTSEAAQIIPLKRNHPSLSVWCGGNELQAGTETPLDDSHPTLAALKQLVKQLDPDRAWLATSPTGRVFSNSLENIWRAPDALHDVHGPWEYQGTLGQYALYNQGTALFHSEFGVEGITNHKTLDRVISPRNQWPVTLDNPFWQHLSAWWVQRPRWDEAFGLLDSVEAYLRATQFTQFDGLRYAVEADRRRKFHTSGTLPWQFNEPYPMAACTSVVDYYGQPKPAYYAVAKAYEPVHVSARFDGITWAGQSAFACEIWVCNSLSQEIPAAGLTARLVGADGRTYHELQIKTSCRANQAALIGKLQCDLTGVEAVFFLDIRLDSPDQRLLSENRYVFSRAENLSPLLMVAKTRLTTELVSVGETWELLVRNDGLQAVLNIWLQDGRPLGSPGFAYFDQNYFCLFPGEARRVRVDWQEVCPVERCVEIGGWNTPQLRLDNLGQVTAHEVIDRGDYL